MEYTIKMIKITNVFNKDIDIPVIHCVMKDLSSVRTLIEHGIVDICVSPDLNYSLEDVKKLIYNTISSKTDLQKYGMCAEFFMHLLLRDLGYNQKFVFCNLEEKSMKKGFDGFYEKSNDFWIAESKCAITNAKHKDKIKEALDDIDNKVGTTTGNNPWYNAVNHILVKQSSNNDKSIIEKVASLSRDYIAKKPHNSSEFNLIPTSTLFINNNQKIEDITNEIKSIIENRKIKDMNILCINNDIYDEFIAYLKEK